VSRHINSEFNTQEIIESSSFKVRSSCGPNGPGMTSVIDDAKNIPESLYKSIARVVNDDVRGLLKRIRNEDTPNHPELNILLNQNKSIRRVTVVEDKENKSRVIAIFDYWSQLALRPLHKALMGILSSIKEDKTYDQSKGLKDFYNDNYGNHFSSLDLKAATDRMPISLQKRILSMLIKDDSVTESYIDILIGYPFDTKKGQIRYSVGQPMGAYSS